jgi:hypothetical protein
VVVDVDRVGRSTGNVDGGGGAATGTGLGAGAA